MFVLASLLTGLEFGPRLTVSSRANSVKVLVFLVVMLLGMGVVELLKLRRPAMAPRAAWAP
jgi:small neutral amino acid transporter SnatA (MarC family)